MSAAEPLPASTEVPEAPPAAGAAAPDGLSVRALSLSGETLLAAAEVGTTTVCELKSRLPPLLPGQVYRITCGERVLEDPEVLEELRSLATDGELLLHAVADRGPNAQQELDMALIEAAGALDAERVTRLLAAGASAAFVHDPPGVWGSQDKKSALHMALPAPRGEARSTIIEALIAAGADVNAVRASSDWRGCGSSESAFEMALPEAIQDARLLQLFLDAGADPNTSSTHTVHSMRTDGCSVKFVLNRAAETGCLEAVRTLLRARAEVDAVSKENFSNERGFNRHMEETAFHAACRRGHTSVAALLLEGGALVDNVRVDLEQEEVTPTRERTTDDPRHPDFEPTVRCVKIEETALHIAIRGGHAELVALLVRAGADASRPRIRGGQGASPQDLCGGDERLLRALQGQEAPAERDEDASEVGGSVSAEA
mmetsp:Transcript_19045/g.54650  ORF Transcript_19045/g.54650 Transcript_19045/m.54650 type:complete len:429 (+) Transcript_19045:99-1385(+)